MQDVNVKVLILAGGKGTRMQSDLPKVLHAVHNKPMITRIVEATTDLTDKPIVVLGHRGELVQEEIGERAEYIWQHEQLGTGHAVLCAKDHPAARAAETVIVVPGDAPLLDASTLHALHRERASTGATISFASIIPPTFDGEYLPYAHFGRVVRKDGEVSGIIEYKDADVETRDIREVNTGYYAFDAAWLWNNITSLSTNNTAKEMYLTDLSPAQYRTIKR
jgi:bifunctional UDP-N-acetylglucosamine pyrophosphorylase / glucosamine-1-phosphate N-acetyltransferase